MKLQYPVQVVMKWDQSCFFRRNWILVTFQMWMGQEGEGRGNENKEIKFFAFYILSEAADFLEQ